MRTVASRAASRATSRAASRVASREASFANLASADFNRAASMTSDMSSSTVPGDVSRRDRHLAEDLGSESLSHNKDHHEELNKEEEEEGELPSRRHLGGHSGSSSVRFSEKDDLAVGVPLSMRKRDKEVARDIDRVAKEAASQIFAKLDAKNLAAKEEEDGRIASVEAAVERLKGWTSEAVVAVRDADSEQTSSYMKRFTYDMTL